MEKNGKGQRKGREGRNVKNGKLDEKRRGKRKQKG